MREGPSPSQGAATNPQDSGPGNCWECQVLEVCLLNVCDVCEMTEGWGANRQRERDRHTEKK